jgi:uncharacterized protein (DUF433 family)
LSTEHPFLSGRFKTDGATIFLDGIGEDETALLDLKYKQFAFREVLRTLFRDLDFEAGAVARWRPLDGKASIVIDPERSFGRPIATQSGVPTFVLDSAVKAEGSVRVVARQFEVSEAVVRDAQRFHAMLDAA